MEEEIVKEYTHDQINAIMRAIPSERDVMTYLLVESGMSYRDLAKRIGVSHDNVMRTYERTRKQLNRLRDAGLFPEPVDN